MDTSKKLGGKLFVVELAGGTKASQIHKVNLKLEPIKKTFSKKQSQVAKESLVEDNMELPKYVKRGLSVMIPRAAHFSGTKKVL